MLHMVLFWLVDCCFLCNTMYFFFDLLFCVLILVKSVILVAVALSGLFSDAFDAIAVHVGSSIANSLLLLLILFCFQIIVLTTWF